MLSDSPDRFLSERNSTPIVAQLCRLCIDTFADFCAVYLRDSHPRASAFAARTGDLYSALAELPYDERFSERAVQLGIRGIHEEPLAAGGRKIGTIVFGTSSADRFDHGSRELVAIVTSILSTAVNQAQELAHHYRVSKRLQKAMLPSRLASAENLSFDVAYRPASDEADVGGDWYDAFEIGDGSIGISVGDVTGHGLEAAVAMSEIRRAIRSAAATMSSPSAWLNYVDAFMVSQGIGMATAVAGRYEPATHVLRYACAGHPSPVLLSKSGAAKFLPAGGLLLGLGMNHASQDWTVTLGPQSSCFLYTDGLLEYNRDVIAGERALLATLERMAKDGKRTAEALHEAIFARDSTSVDDCATLALHHGAALEQRDLLLHFSASPLFAPIVRDSIRNYARAVHVSQERLHDILSATGEATANAIEHGANDAGSTFQIDGSVSDEGLTIAVESRGHWRPFTPREERGRGVPIMRACSKAVEISSTQELTRVVMRFAL